MKNPKIILHQWEISPFCSKIRKILKHKGLKFSVVNYNGILALKRRRVSTTGKLPVLEYDGKKIKDSTKIANFLEKLYPEPSLFPAEDRDRHLASILEDWADEYLYWFEIYFAVNEPKNLEKRSQLLCEGRPWFEKELLKRVFQYESRKKLCSVGLGSLSKKEVEKLFTSCLDNINGMLQNQTHLVGESPTIADFAISAQLDELVRTSAQKEKILSYPNIKDWLKKMEEPNHSI